MDELFVIYSISRSAQEDDGAILSVAKANRNRTQLVHVDERGNGKRVGTVHQGI